MKMRRTVLLLFTFGAILHGVAQDDKAYFQQYVDYKINAVLDDENHMINCNMDIMYVNNSPDVLNEIHFNVWPNAYRDRHTTLGRQLRDSKDFDFQFSSPKERGWLDSLSFTVNAYPVEHIVKDKDGEHVVLPLQTPLNSGDTVWINTPFRVKIPSGDFSRLGHIGQSYMVTQWYPKPAVYDKDGWHVMPYLNQGEFYSEFGKFEVTMTVPASYYVGATGRMSDGERETLLERNTQTKAIENFPDNEFPKNSRYWRVLTFKQENIHDFAWFADKRFNVLHDTLVLPHSGRVIDAWVLFTNDKPEAWLQSMEYVKDGTRFYSQHVGDYPYDHVTVVDGTLTAGGGMEYPMITVINGTSNQRSLEKVIVHEIGHNWFYGILGSNERDHAWMDEGVNSFYEVRYFEEKYGRKSIAEGRFAEFVPDDRGLNELGYLLAAREHVDQELTLCSHRYTGVNYGVMVYSKAAYLMQYMRSVMGSALFDASMKHYYEKWKYKHPGPNDMQVALEEHSGMDLNWFFEDLIGTKKKVDFKVASFDEASSEITIKSKTSYEGPLSVGYFKDGNLLGTQTLSSGIATKTNHSGFDRVVIDPDRDMPEIKRKNNLYRVNGLIKTMPEFKLQRFTRSGDSEDWLVFYNPVLGWNDHDRWMLGLDLSNFELVAKDLEWNLTPMYSISSKEVVGLAEVKKKFWLGEESPNRLHLGVRAKRFSEVNNGTGSAQYLTVKPSIGVTIIPESLKGGIFSLNYTAHYVRNDYSSLLNATSTTIENTYHAISYTYGFSRGLFETDLAAEFEFNQDFSKATVTLKDQWVYNDMDKKVGFRVYGSKIWVNDMANIGNANPSLVGQSGREGFSSGDYRYDNLYLGRGNSTGFLSQQYVNNRGGFTYTGRQGASDNWAVSINLNADLPIPLPLSVYFNYGLYDLSVRTSDSSFYETTSLFEGGFTFSIVKDAIDVSFPLVLSSNIKETNIYKESTFGQRIRFQIRLEKLRPREIVFKNVMQ